MSSTPEESPTPCPTITKTDMPSGQSPEDTPTRHPTITKKDIELPLGQKKLAFVLENVLTPEECERYIEMTEEMGYDPALVNVGYGRQQLMTDVRNNTRCIWDSEEEAGKLWDRIKEHVPAQWAGKRVMGLNERLRFLKYEPGQYFQPHMDGCYRRENGEKSYITIQLYLNEGFSGGSTTFLSTRWGASDTPNEDVECVPKTGMVLVFQHDILHEGSTLNSGRKYAMRTDVMYSAKSIAREESS